jgi:hypothetical protein
MITSADALKNYGPPKKEMAMILWEVPEDRRIAVMPHRIYCNRDLIKPLADALLLLAVKNCAKEMKTWDGCFNIRKKKGGISDSLHSWGLAIDVNAAWNPFGKPPALSAQFVQCFTLAGFAWGGNWKIPDGMHFELANLMARIPNKDQAK